MPDSNKKETEKMPVFNLKFISKDVRNNFKKNTHDNGLTMQSALSAFVESYNDNPGKFRLVMEVVK